MDGDPSVHHAAFELNAGPVRSTASVDITSGGLLAIGALVSGIILAVVPLVWAATGPARKRAETGQEPKRLSGGRKAS